MSTATTLPTSSTRGRRTNTKLDRVQRAIALEQLEKERREVAGRAQRFSANHRFVLFVFLGLAVFMAAASFTTSFAGLYGAAAWAIGDNPWLQVAAPLIYDVSILALTLKLFGDREDGESVLWDWIWIGTLATVSAVANVTHTLDVSTAKTLPQLVIGAIISGSAPYLLALVSDVVAAKVFRKPADG